MTRDEFAARVTANEKKLYLSALSVTRNAEDAEDAVAGGVYIALQQLESLRDEEKFDAWLLRIVLNEAYRIRKKARSYQSIEDVSDMFSEPPDTDALEFFDILSRLDIDVQSRRIFALRFFYCYTLEETAKIMDMNENSVKAKYYRSLKKLQKKYGKGGLTE